MVIDAFDVRPDAWRRLEDIAHEREIDFVMHARISRRVHQLHGEIDALGWRVCVLDGEDIFLAQDRYVTFDHEPCALVMIGDHAFAEDDSFARLEFDLKRHSTLQICRTDTAIVMVYG